MQYRQSRYDRIFDHFGDKYRVFPETTHTQLECRECGGRFRLTNQSINRYIREGVVYKCKSDYCDPRVGENFLLSRIDDVDDIPVMRCVDCDLEFYNHKKTRYFRCYCELKTKNDEHRLYTKLVEKGFRVYREAYFDKTVSSHKSDMLVFLSDDRKVFLEVDGREHNGSAKDQEFQALFSEYRSDEEYLVRVSNLISDLDLQCFVNQLENTEIEPICKLVGSDTGMPVFRDL